MVCELHLHFSPSPSALRRLKELGWRVVCFVSSLEEFSALRVEIEGLSGEVGIEVLGGCELEAKGRGEVKRKAREGLKEGADLVFFKPLSEEAAKKAAQCWEVDVLTGLEKLSCDTTMAKFMAERRIAFELALSPISVSSAEERVELLSKLSEGLRIVTKHRAPVILTSRAKSEKELRSPKDLEAFGRLMGLENSSEALRGHPRELLAKAKARRDPNVLLRGLEVLRWGQLRPLRKKLWGWY